MATLKEFADSDPDRAKAARVLETLPPDARLLSALRSEAPMRRIPAWLAEAGHRTHETLAADPVDFIDPEVAHAHHTLVEALDELGERFGDTFPPLSGDDISYTEVPPEWRRKDSDRYYETLRNLSTARQGVLNAYKELINAMNTRGHLPTPSSPDDQPSGQHVRITSGDNSPVTVNASSAHASGSSTSTANTHQPPPLSPAPSPSPPTPWYRSATWWTALGAIAAVAAAVAGFLALK
ncbi:hypothetical protein GA0115240_15414 [Streptomyces sp. DvalAA-14]|uniref:hypothetical protein n=1 Tax=unclassified Streptomyces TaxID=2593676 RepID=UPI00081B4718|nr:MULTISPECIES: hypothetical protein [unclassified Streptomyces]MYS23568.1 hypothetical protein [Streptomyces sp. SID4948]SCE35525.1 hypothetical protein GA0115240_15414 [Streptomyces sp. DvalAA-14]